MEEKIIVAGLHPYSIPGFRETTYQESFNEILKSESNYW